MREGSIVEKSLFATWARMTGLCLLHWYDMSFSFLFSQVGGGIWLTFGRGKKKDAFVGHGLVWTTLFSSWFGIEVDEVQVF